MLAQEARDPAELYADHTAAALLKDPIGTKDGLPGRGQGLEPAFLRSLQLSALKMRFTALRDRIPMLKKLSDNVGISRINQLEDVISILFKHTVYKSYPVSLLEQGRFPQLTQWLNKLVAFDLSTKTVSHCRTVDDWIATLDRETPLELRYSSGTSGTMSFLPQTRDETDRQFRGNMADLFDHCGAVRPGSPEFKPMAVILPNYRSGATGWARYADYQVKYLCGGDESMCYALYSGSVSADIMFLAGRIRAARQKGTLERLNLSAALLERKAEFEALQGRRSSDLAAFYDRVMTELREQRVHIQAPWSALEGIADAGLARGLEGIFSADSIILAAGGTKGVAVADNWEDKTKRFLGVDRLSFLYGMTEVQSPSLMCSHERYHVEPTNILFVLDPDTGDALPRRGSQIGRAAFYDLLAESHWGGFITGDEISVEWDALCGCGRRSPHLHRTITRFADKRGGDDKISCASVADAHEEALNYLLELPG